MKKEKLFFGQIQLLNSLTNRLSMKQLSVKSIQLLVKLQKELNDKIKDFRETQEKILKSYDLKPDNTGNYDWTEHKDKEEIGEKITELAKEKIPVNKDLLNFIKEDDLIASAKESGLSLNEMGILIELLTIKQTK